MKSKNAPYHIKMSSLIFALSFYIAAIAQDSGDTIIPKSYFKFSTSYLTNSVYSGRKDSLTLPYITPSLTYHNKSGFYVQGSLSYLASPGESQIDATTLTAGHEFHNKNEKFTGDVYVSEYFYNDASSAVRSQVNTSLGTYFSYNAGVISLSGGTDLSLSSKADLTLSAGASHAFDINQFSITPTALLNAGSQNYYDSYFKKRKFSAKRKRKIGANINPNSIIVMKKDFAVLDYELSSPVNYDGKKWGLFFTPTYAIPVNPVSYSINNGASYKAEKLSNSFYAEAGVYVKF